MPKIIETIADLIDWRAAISSDKRIGFVPTMGNLHVGHQALLERSQGENDLTVLSIFVNPTQFNQASDFEKYPKTLAADLELAEQAGAAIVFVPNTAELYPDDYQLQVIDTLEIQRMEGLARPGHFTGMLTIVLKLLQLVRAQRAYFGEKDYQQLLLVQQLVRAFFVPTEIVACETVRLASGLPYSSRNSRLTVDELTLAHEFAGIIREDKPLDALRAKLLVKNIRVDYLEEHDSRRFAAVWINEVRLIDNFCK